MGTCKSVNLAELESLSLQATQGTWSWEAVGEKDNSWCLGTECEGEVVDFIAESGSCENLADPVLICLMRNLLPGLIAEIKYLRKQVESAA